MKLRPLFFAVMAAIFALPAHALDKIPTGMPLADHVVHPLGFEAANGPIAEVVTGLYNEIFWICLAVYILVQGLILYAIVAFRKSNRRKNSDAKQFSHNTFIEVLWTVVPVLICGYIGWRAMEGMMYIRTMPKGDVHIDVIAQRFSWDFDYQDYGISAPESMTADQRISLPDQPRLVKSMVVPQGKDVVLSLTSRDVIHSFYSPALEVKTDAIPGRINYLWFRADKVGDFLGQCTELCGSGHGEMFFNIKVLPEAKFEAWVNQQRTDNGMKPFFTTTAKAADAAPAAQVVPVADHPQQ